MSAMPRAARVGKLLRGWRQRRNIRQFELSLEAFYPADDVTAATLAASKV